jgi:DNA-binding CsgD family transcriptional regulator
VRLGEKRIETQQGGRPVPDDTIGLDTELIASLYDAVVDAAALGDLMRRFADTVGCDVAYFKLVDRASGSVIAGAGGRPDDGSDRDYLENYLSSDVRVPRVDAAPYGLILEDGQLIGEDERRRSAFHHEWLPRYGLAHLIHTNLAPAARYTAIVTCGQSRERGPFGDRQRFLVGRYARHFARLANLRRRTYELGGHAFLTSAAFDHLPVAGTILDSTGQVIYANAAARETLAAADGLGIRDDRLWTADPVAARALARAMARVAGTLVDGLSADGPRQGVGVAVGRPSGRAPFTVEFLPLPPASGVRREDDRAALVALIHDTERTLRLRTGLLRDLYGLTPAEAKLAIAVAAGATLREYAERRRISVGTTRYQMKQVLGKTGCRRQTDLVRLISIGA